MPGMPTISHHIENFHLKWTISWTIHFMQFPLKMSMICSHIPLFISTEFHSVESMWTFHVRTGFGMAWNHGYFHMACGAPDFRDVNWFLNPVIEYYRSITYKPIVFDTRWCPDLRDMFISFYSLHNTSSIYHQQKLNLKLFFNTNWTLSTRGTTLHVITIKSTNLF